MNVHQTADKIEAAAQGMGYQVRSHKAQTGTIYLTVTAGEIEVTVRVSDHMEAYEPIRGQRKISVSPFELSAQDAIEMLREPASIERYVPEPPSADERRWAGEANRRAAEQKARCAAALAQIPAEVVEAFKASDFNKKQRAKAIAEQYGLKVGLVYEGLTGRKF